MASVFLISLMYPTKPMFGIVDDEINFFLVSPMSPTKPTFGIVNDEINLFFPFFCDADCEVWTGGVFLQHFRLEHASFSPNPCV